jgi:hypothetical protein
LDDALLRSRPGAIRLDLELLPQLALLVFAGLQGVLRARARADNRRTPRRKVLRWS